MAVAELKTKKTKASVGDFIDSLTDAVQQKEAKELLSLFNEHTNEIPEMWGPAMVGYGQEHLKYASGRELDWFKVGFSPRKGTFSLYVLRGAREQYVDLLAKLGKHSLGVGCLYIKRLSDIDLEVLKQIVKLAITQ